MTQNPLSISDIDISHRRLEELTRLADQAEPFYNWVATQFQETLHMDATFEQILNSASKSQLEQAILYCYNPPHESAFPLLFDGVGRSYPHKQACYYFFSWLIRDAPKQRLEPLIQRIVKKSQRQRQEVEADVLASLIYQYRQNIKTFSWVAVREVFVERLEGSRRAIKGHEKEAIIRTALLVSIQSFFQKYQSYGSYTKVEIAKTQVTINNETFDVSASLSDTANNIVHRILLPIKTRETEGGGHSHLFTRDISSAINSVKLHDTQDFLIVVIIARNWSQREMQTISDNVDQLIIFDISPGDFNTFAEKQQNELNTFIEGVLSGRVIPKQN